MKNYAKGWKAINDKKGLSPELGFILFIIGLAISGM